jgi:hypothetical protein
MFPLFSALSFLVAFIGLTALSQATLGVGLMTGAILLAIYARIAQAGEQHREIMARTQPSQPRTQPPSPSRIET